MDRPANLLNLPTTLLGIFAHPDDEVVGAGGLLAKNAKCGGTSIALCLTGDATRKEEFAAATKKLGIQGRCLSLPEGKLLENRRETVMKLREFVINNKPQYIITHREEWDYQDDHQATCLLAHEAASRAHTKKNGWIIDGFLLTESQALHPFVHFFVNVTQEYDKVKGALQLHSSQIEKNDGYYLRVLDARTKLRGTQAGCERAEAFIFEPFRLLASSGRWDLGA